MTLLVRSITPDDLKLVSEVLGAAWGGVTVMALSRGEMVDAARQPGFLVFDGDDLAGLITYIERSDGVEVVTINALHQGKGVGALLLDAVRDAARLSGASRVWLTTTNDNTTALRFYQRYGFDLAALHRNAADRARERKPGIPREKDGIPIRHYLELELALEHPPGS
ncbi:GNAT family N-acetyltransferase [Nonomuraea sp. NBC_01738]|uniref:GNAT family N-acetyltransferase n=1 Tax=Nonomuraea sp. NBC_01738 TaxID=2976003 RepID=UPI002E1101F0|nr:GNAT family N-acetyltransferase [Nonomuraea sp. NBC_01738]